MTVSAETDLPTGCDTSLETVRRDGRRDVGGIGGRPLDPGRHLSTYPGGHKRGLRAWSSGLTPRVHRLLMKLDSGEQRELLPVANDPALGRTVHMTSPPWAACPAELKGLDAEDNVVSAATSNISPRYRETDIAVGALQARS